MQYRKTVTKTGSVLLSVLMVFTAFMFTSSVSAAEATLILSPSSKTILIDDTIELQLQANTGAAEISGIDAILKYDDSLLEVIDQNSNTSGVQIKPGSFLGNAVINTASDGRIEYSQIANLGDTVSGSGIVATIQFRALNTGTAEVTLEFTQGETTDSNIAAAGTDILTAVSNATIQIHDEDDTTEDSPSGGSVSGHIGQDQVGGTGVSNVTVTVGSTSTQTDTDGFFEINNIPSGTHDVVISKDGYNPYTYQQLAVDDGETPYLNLYLTQNSNASIDAGCSDVVGTPKLLHNNTLRNQLKGTIIVRVQKAGEAYYVHPNKQEMYYLCRPQHAFEIMRTQSLGIDSEDLMKIPMAIDAIDSTDTDGDQLIDLFERAIGTNPENIDTDGDGYSDYTEVSTGYSPLHSNGKRLEVNADLGIQLAGRLLLDVHRHGEVWYVDTSGIRHYVGRPEHAFALMRNLGLGISEYNFSNL